MQLPSYALLSLGICSQVYVTLAGRGTHPGNGPPTVCNNEPDGLGGDQKTALDVASRSFHSRRAVRTPPIGSIPSDWKRALLERSGLVTYNDNCNAALPIGSKYGAGFPTKKDVVVKAYADAVELANQASVILETSPA